MTVKLSNNPDRNVARRIAEHTRGSSAHGPIIRLMSPSDLGQMLKPFVFLDFFDASGKAIHAMSDMPLHPHSGIATVTVFTQGKVHYNDPASGQGTFGYGGVEWMRAGNGVWHGKELSAGDVPEYRDSSCGLLCPRNLRIASQKVAISSLWAVMRDIHGMLLSENTKVYKAPFQPLKA